MLCQCQKTKQNMRSFATHYKTMIWGFRRDEFNMRAVGIEMDSFDAMKCLEVEMS